MTVDVTQFHKVFFEESFEHLANMENGLLGLEASDNDPELINVIFRGAHSIKGGSGTFGFLSVSEFTHLVETLLEHLRSGITVTNPEIISILLEAVDELREMIAALQAGDEPDLTRSKSLQLRLQNILEEIGGSVPGKPSAKHEPSVESQDIDNQGWHITFRPYRHFFHTGNDPYRILRELAALGEMKMDTKITAIPDFMELNPEECFLAWEIELSSTAPRVEIDEIFAWVEGDCDLDIVPLVRELAPDTALMAGSGDKNGINNTTVSAERRSGSERRYTESESIRVSIEKIDAIINMVGELVITQSMLSQVGSKEGEVNTLSSERLRDGLAQLERNTRELQEGVMRIRMLPISFAFQRFPRLVHDLSQKLGKKVELKLSGEQTELDKTVMEKIGDPLVHLVRNSLDHGIELPSERRVSGKPEVGQIHLNAYHQGGNVIIEISDDGAGLSRKNITARAKERGLIAADIDPDEEQIANMIFEPGFSTADTVSDVSGRGVGMDVVRRNIRDLGGTVEVSSKEGRGTRFTIRLPLTLAILDGQLVSVGEQIYIIPLVSIVESIQVNAERVNELVGSAQVHRLRNEYIPIMDLRQAFQLDGDTASLAGSLLVVVEGEGKKAGLLVDDLLGQQQVVIKSLESNYKPVEGISGATILGDGTVALILDAARLVNMGCTNSARAGSMADSVIAA